MRRASSRAMSRVHGDPCRPIVCRRKKAQTRICTARLSGDGPYTPSLPAYGFGAPPVVIGRKPIDAYNIMAFVEKMAGHVKTNFGDQSGGVSSRFVVLAKLLA